MSYSYVKSVFPDFKYSNVYDTKLYDTSIYDKPSTDIIPAEQTTNVFAKVNEITKENNKENFQNNLKFYNTSHTSLVPDNKENFQNNNSTNNLKETNHLEYTKHILECEECKQIIMKQLNIDNDRIRSEEIMELISFIMFGVFILLLLDNIKK